LTTKETKNTKTEKAKDFFLVSTTNTIFLLQQPTLCKKKNFFLSLCELCGKTFLVPATPN